MACGLPVMASDVSDNNKFISDGDNGYLFNPSDLPSISKALVKFSKLSEVDINLMKASSRKKAEKFFSETVFINKYLKIISTL